MYRYIFLECNILPISYIALQSTDAERTKPGMLRSRSCTT